VAAVLDDDGAPVEPAHPGQRLDQGVGLVHGLLAGVHEEYAEFSCTYSLVRSVVHTVAEAPPADRSTVTVTSRPVRSTRERSSPTPPLRHTQTPLMATSIWAGSKAGEVVPTAASTRPQLGSSPYIAHLKRLLQARSEEHTSELQSREN